MTSNDGNTGQGGQPGVEMINTGDGDVVSPATNEGNDPTGGNTGQGGQPGAWVGDGKDTGQGGKLGADGHEEYTTGGNTGQGGQPGAKVVNRKNVEEWDITDVRDWLESIDMDRYSSTFVEEEITGEALVLLTKEDMLAFGIKRTHSLILLKKIKQL